MTPHARLSRAPRRILALLRHCLGGRPPLRPSARARLEAELGPELARRLVTTLTVGSRG